MQSIGSDLGACYGIVPAVNEMIIETGSKVNGFAMQLLGYCDLLVKVNKKFNNFKDYIMMVKRG